MSNIRCPKCGTSHAIYVFACAKYRVAVNNGLDMPHEPTEPDNSFQALMDCDETSELEIVENEPTAECENCGHTDYFDRFREKIKGDSDPVEKIHKLSATIAIADTQLWEIRSDLAKLNGWPPHNVGSNIVRGDGYFAKSIERRWGKELLHKALNYLEVLGIGSDYEPESGVMNKDIED